MLKRVKAVLGVLVIVVGLSLVSGASALSDEGMIVTDDGIRVSSNSDVSTSGLTKGKCGGTAPAVTSCSTGNWTREAGFLHGFNTPGPHETYALTSQMTWDTGKYVLTCHWFAGEYLFCEREGEFPPTDAEFRHDCYAEWPAAGSAPTMNGPGGVGGWECVMVATPV